jgi:RNA polymerase sigma-70 factor (ECF subfamily)
LTRKRTVLGLDERRQRRGRIVLQANFCFASHVEFPTTQWTLLADATLHGDATAAQALAEFIRRYRGPVVQLVRIRGWPAAEVEDLAQDFLVHVMEKSTLRRFDANRGRFRSYLLGALVRFLGDARERQTAVKRGGAIPPVTLESAEYQGDLAATPPPDAAAFDQQWALDLLALTLAALAAEYAQRGRTADFAILRAYVPGGIQPPPYEESATALGVPLAAFKTEVHRMRKRFRLLLREQVAATVGSHEEVEAEFLYLRQVLQEATL